ncbi:MAG: aminotransferase class V-fold PLP-dependent enzyme [Gemmatimonadota bacterium]
MTFAAPASYQGPGIVPFGHNFLPGPTDVHPEVLEAMRHPMVAHRSRLMHDTLARMQPRLQRMFGTAEPVFIVTASATGLSEAAIRNGVRQRVLVVIAGFFGDMFAKIAESCGKEVIRVIVPPGAIILPEQLESFLDGPKVDAVLVVHSESSTGALAPVEALARVVRSKPDTMFMVDGVTSVGAVPIEMDRWGADFMFTGSQKALAVPPGLAIGAASARFIARAREQDDVGFYFDLDKAVTTARENLPIWTPAESLYMALDRQLERIDVAGGLERRFERHRSLGRRMAEWVAAEPRVRLLASDPYRSPSVSALVLPAERPARELVKALEEREFLIGNALDPRHGNVVRVGHMGDLEVVHLDALLDALAPLI